MASWTSTNPALARAFAPVFDERDDTGTPGGTREEDGFILTFVHEEGQAQGAFHILDARNLADAPLAVVRLPRRVPAGLHGSWVAG